MLKTLICGTTIHFFLKIINITVMIYFSGCFMGNLSSKRTNVMIHNLPNNQPKTCSRICQSWPYFGLMVMLKRCFFLEISVCHIFRLLIIIKCYFNTHCNRKYNQYTFYIQYMYNLVYCWKMYNLGSFSGLFHSECK